ncbi:unnamed protein product [Alopecurus aequalis]
MASGQFLLLLCLAVSVLLQARAQPDSKGFISVDCGLSGETGYEDDLTTLTFAPDAGFIDAGTNRNISAEYITPPMRKIWYNVRSFPAGERNCYTLRSLVAGLKYLIRARFLYGNYDGLNRPPLFDLHIGVNYWHTVNISEPDGAIFVEGIVVVPDDSVQVCLVNTGAGTPFISSLELRPLKRTLYPQATAAQGLALMTRHNFGPTNDTASIRYPDDPHDRIWYPMPDTATWADQISTTQKVQYIDNDVFEAPSVVLQTAVRPRNTSENIVFTWPSDPTPTDTSPGYIIILHFAELQLLRGNAVRQMNVILNDKPWYTSGFPPVYLHDTVAYNGIPFRNSSYTLSVSATALTRPCRRSSTLSRSSPSSPPPTSALTPRTYLQ